MRVKIPRWEIAVICSALLFPGTSLSAQEVGQEEKEVKEMRQDVEQLQQDVRQLREEVRRLQEEIHGFRHNSFPQCGADTVAPYVPHHFIHRLGIEARPQYVFPTNPFLQGENERWKPIQSSFAAHLKYSFKFRPNTCADRIYGGAYQGFGLAFTTFGDKKQLGDPMTFYVFQGARIARFNPRLSLNYEWNFGISAGWKPYDNDYNSYNGAVGSRVNAYLNAGIQALQANMELRYYPKDTRIVQAGVTDRLVYFIEEGIARSVFHHNGEDTTTWFSQEGDVTFGMDSLYYQQPSVESVETLSDCKIYVIHIDKLNALYETYIDIANWGRILHQNVNKELSHMFVERLQLSPKERYEQFNRRYPGLINRVKLKYVAAFLGISIYTLSRVRAKK